MAQHPSYQHRLPEVPPVAHHHHRRLYHGRLASGLRRGLLPQQFPHSASSHSPQPTKPSFNSTFSSASPSTGFSFGASSVSVAATNSAPMVFGSSTPTSGSLDSIFMFTSAASTATASSQAQPMFGSAVPVFTAASGNGDQMSMEDSMAEDPVQASIMPAVPVFGQPPISAPSSGFMFGSTAPSPGLAFQFGSQQPNQSAPQNPSLFQSSGSLEFGAGGSFSLGSGATTDKSGRKIVKVKHKNRKK